MGTKVVDPKGERSQRDRWDKAQVVGNIAGAVAVPLILVVAGFFINSSIQSGEETVKRIEIAADVLREDPGKYKELPELRQWAIETLEEELSLPKEVGPGLLKSRLPGPRSAAPKGPCCVSCLGWTVCGRKVNLGKCGSCDVGNIDSIEDLQFEFSKEEQ